MTCSDQDRSVGGRSRHDRVGQSSANHRDGAAERQEDSTPIAAKSVFNHLFALPRQHGGHLAASCLVALVTSDQFAAMRRQGWGKAHSSALTVNYDW